MERLIEIRWHGRGGQGVVTAGKLLTDLALDANYYFQAFPDYGPERTGAPIRAFTRLSPEPIHLHSQIEEPDVVVVLDPTLLGTVDVCEGLKPDGMLIVNTAESPAEVRRKLNLKTAHVATVDATRIALDTLGKAITNTPMLGALVKVTGIIEEDKLIDQVRKNFAKKFKPAIVEANVAAIERASQEIQKD